MPADLKDPFGPSCCEAGGELNAGSCQPCGCDKNAGWLCSQHKVKYVINCCIIGCDNTITDHHAYCNSCWDGLEDE